MTTSEGTFPQLTGEPLDSPPDFDVRLSSSQGEEVPEAIRIRLNDLQDLICDLLHKNQQLRFRLAARADGYPETHEK